MPPRKKAYSGKRRADEDAPVPGQFIQPVGPSSSSDTRRASRPRHLREEPKESKPPAAPRKKAVPAAVSKTPPSREQSGGRERDRTVAEEGRDYAYRQALRATEGRPSTAGRAVAGGAAGAATGAMMAGPPGAVVGGGVGAIGGGVAGAKAKRAYKAATRTNAHARRVIVAEFAVCVVIVALSPLTDKHKDEPAGALMKRFTAVLGLFFVLALLSAAGPGMARAAAGLGGLVTTVLAVSERNLFAKIATIISSRSDAPSPGNEVITGAGAAVGEAAQTGAGQVSWGVGGARSTMDPLGGDLAERAGR